MIGLYLHIPFCVRKCPYCDFYSLAATEEAMDAYTAVLEQRIRQDGKRYGGVDTVYFGGGTPSLLGGRRIARLLTAVQENFGVASDAEITLEANPADRLDDVFAAFAAAGGNRVSLGMQAANDAALHALGRRHSVTEVAAAVGAAHRAGIDNLSLDVMLGTPRQTEQDVADAVRYAATLGATHLSAYLLKLEEGTPFGAHPPLLPDEEQTAALYHAACAAAAAHGFAQYEISNWARDGKVARHNLKYWNGEPYLGLGPSAHSFLEGRRWYFPRSLAAFTADAPLLPEADGDDALPENGEAEYAMLRLRLVEGLREDLFSARFGHTIPALWRDRAAAIPPELLTADADGIRLTPDGFLVSNAILARLLLE